MEPASRPRPSRLRADLPHRGVNLGPGPVEIRLKAMGLGAGGWDPADSPPSTGVLDLPPGLAAALYDMFWAVLALQIFLVVAHITAALLFAVDLRPALGCLLGFSVLLWTAALLYLIPMLVTHLTPSPFGMESPDAGPVTDGYLDAPGPDFGGGKPGPRFDDGF